LTILTVLLATGSVARAQDARGADDPAEACFSAAERAQPLLRQKRLREARALLDVCARDACPRVARTDCRQWLAEANDAQPSIVVAAREMNGAGVARSVKGLRVVIDDALVVDTADAGAIVLDPGHHRLRFERPGADPLVQDVDVAEGEKGRVVDVIWHDAATVRPSRPVPAAAIVTAAFGVAAAGVGAYFEIAGLSQREHLDNTCKPTASCTDDQVSSARRQFLIGDIAIGGGVALLAGAAVIFFTRPAVEPRPAPASTAWTIAPVPGGLWVGARGEL
jgi:hypothetical protein